jgi:hypothetical protein
VARETHTSSPSLALNNLRGIVILVVLAFHSVLAYLRYGPAAPLPLDDPPYMWRSFPIVDSERWFGFDIFCALQDVYLISLMFFLSGLFVWKSLARRGSRAFLIERLMRLGLPCALVVLFLEPIAHYPVYLQTATDPSVSAFWEHWIALPFWPSGPPWFLWILLFFDLTAAALFAFARGTGPFLARLCGDPARFVVVLLAASAIAYTPLALAFTPWEWKQIGPFAFQLSRPLHYAVYFFGGVGVGAYGIDRGLLASDGWLVQRWRTALAATVVTYLAWLGAMGLAVQSNGPAPIWVQLLAALCFVLCCGAGSLCLLAIVIRFGNRRWPRFDIFNENAYGLYLVHYVFVVWLQFAMLSVPIFAFAKGLIVFLGTLVLSLLFVAIIRRMPVAARIIGSEGRAVPTVR